MLHNQRSSASSFVTTTIILCASGCLMLPACHEIPPEPTQSVKQTGTGLPGSWGAPPLCAHGFLIGNRGAGPGMALGVRPVESKGSPQTVVLSSISGTAPLSHVWALSTWTGFEFQRVRNVFQPGNDLSTVVQDDGSVIVEGRGADPTKPFSYGDALQWRLQRSGPVETGGQFGDSWFELIPATMPESALHVGAASDTTLGVSPRQSPAPDAQLWNFSPIELCDAAE